jgi:hypothetical protein
LPALAASQQLPDITRPDVSLVVVSEWPAVRPDRQRTTADLILAAWERGPWPNDLLSQNAFLSSDGEAVLSYEQWKGTEAVPELVRTCGAARGRGNDPAVHGLEPGGPVAYRLYCSAVRERVKVPGCIVVLSVTLDRPSESRQRQWVDAVLDAMAAETDPLEGGISGHFHLGTDGVHVLVYAEWTSEEAYRLATLRSGALGSGPEWHHVQTFPGVIFGGFKGYHLLRSLVLA